MGAEPTPGQGCLFYGEGLASVTRAQQNCVIEVGEEVCGMDGCMHVGGGNPSSTSFHTQPSTHTPLHIQVPSSVPGETHFLWTGDRWMQSPDGLKGHEPQFWAPLRFDAHGRVREMAWVDGFVLDVGGAGEEAEEEEGVVAVS